MVPQRHDRNVSASGLLSYSYAEFVEAFHIECELRLHFRAMRYALIIEPVDDHLTLQIYEPSRC